MGKRAPEIEKEPTVLGIIFYAFVMAMIGALLGFTYLASFPAKVFPSKADRDRYLETSKEDAEKGVPEVYYLAGVASSGFTWENKRTALIEGAEEPMILTGGELNAWMSATFQSLSAQVAKADAEQGKMEILPGVPNFFVEGENSLYISLPLQVSLMGLSGRHVAFVKGSFTDGPFAEFVPEKFYLNSAPIPVEGGLGQLILEQLANAYSATDEYVAFQSALDNARKIELGDGAVKLTFN